MLKSIQTLHKEAPSLTYSDLAKLYILGSEAATAVLPQIVDGYGLDVACYSTSHAPSLAELLCYEKEALAASLTVNHIRSNLYGKEFRLRTSQDSFI